MKIVLTIAAVLAVSAAYAQPNPPATPIDGGLGLLLVAGAAYGVKKMKDHRRANK